MTALPGTPTVEVADLHVVRGGVRAVDGVSFALSSGVVTGLLGPSGSGKTSLIRALVGVQVVQSGAVSLDELPAGAPALRERIGYVTQAPSVYGDLTVEENLRFFARVLGLGDGEVQEAIGAVRLEPQRRQTVDTLSGGERSRVSLAAALLGRPAFLLLDEPTVGLDPVLRRDLWQLFHEMAEAGATVLVSSHVMDEAERCDRLLLMRAGRILADDTPAGLLQRTGASTVEHAFLSLVDEAA